MTCVGIDITKSTARVALMTGGSAQCLDVREATAMPLPGLDPLDADAGSLSEARFQELQRAILAMARSRVAQVSAPNAVVAIPSYYSPKAATIVERAGDQEGFPQMRTIAEPTAAALAFLGARPFNGHVIASVCLTITSI